YFEKASKTQELMHNLKYRGEQDVGVKLAQILCDKFKEAKRSIPYEAIVCIPLHKQKLKLRSYNQCTRFSQELSKQWKLPFYSNIIIRTQNNSSQTKKSRLSRWENVEQIFYLKNGEKIKERHVLLIDDILTTGATLEACGKEILLVEGTKLSILTMACTV
ncbi:MAG: ComF family protein, partial [Bacteroidetes bacterium]|nr:ComF family protein [Bacteroidota bacterium]